MLFKIQKSSQKYKKMLSSWVTCVSVRLREDLGRISTFIHSFSFIFIYSIIHIIHSFFNVRLFYLAYEMGLMINVIDNT